MAGLKLSVSIMAHPKRKLEANKLYKELMQYQFSDVYIVWDRLNNEWDTGRRALEGGKVLGSDWHLVIQDDAILTPCFYENLLGVIEAMPIKSIVSLYTGRVRPLPERVEKAVARAPEGSFITHYMMMWGVAVLLQSKHIGDLLDFIDNPKFAQDKYDIKLGRFYLANALPIYYSMPSLVDHNDSIGSLIGNGYAKAPRVAHRLATGPVSWTGHTITL